MGEKGYTSKQQPKNLDVYVTGAGTSANPEEYKDDNALSTTDASNNGQADGDNPSMPSTVPFGNGPDVRKR